MTNNGWGSKWTSGAGWFDKPKLENTSGLNAETAKANSMNKWPVAPIPGWPKNDPEDIREEFSGVTPEMLGVKPTALTGLDLGAGERTVLTTFEGNEIKHKIIELKSQGSNLVDAQAYLYFQCDGCQAILDPHTKSFRTLQEYRVNAGWACKWNIDGMGYKVYCAECGENV